MQVWCGLADTKEAARACLAPAMGAFYQLPFERFERYCPYQLDDVAEFLAPYATAGCREFNLIPQAPDHDYAIAGTASVKESPGASMTDTPHRAAFPRPPTEGSALMESSAIFETHPVRRRFNAWFFTAFDRYINWLVRDQKRTVFSAAAGAC